MVYALVSGLIVWLECALTAQLNQPPLQSAVLLQFDLLPLLPI